MSDLFSGQVRLLIDGRFLGVVRIELGRTADHRGSGWGGRIVGSDYLMWGLNHRVASVEFDDGTSASVVVLASGQIRGIGEFPIA